MAVRGGSFGREGLTLKTDFGDVCATFQSKL